ncbi:MAG: FesM [Gemmatimonadota bacterium]|nr:FesM [Gemmatimonadota bacterium]
MRAGTDVLRWPVIGRFLKWPGSRTVMQLPLFAVAALMVWHGLTGPQVAPRNLSTVLTWVHYRGALMLGLLVAGNLFCMACPFMLPRNVARKLVAPVRQWPAALRNKWLAIGLLVAVLFSYELFDLWDSPWWTAWLIVGYFGVALLLDSLFANAPFCKYVCPLGQFNFVASTVSPLTLQVADPEVCNACATRDCINGTRDQANPLRLTRRGCELALFQPQKRGNMDCTLCLDCVYACPHDNIALTTRLPASELWDNGRRSGVGFLAERPDLAVLALVFTFGALLNAFAMVSPIQAVHAWLGNLLGTSREGSVLGTLFFIGLVIEPVALLGLASVLTRRAAGTTERLLPLLGRFAYALVPVGFGVWAAHYAFHTLSGLLTFIPVAEEALGLGSPAWYLRGVPPGIVLPFAYGLMGLGTVGSLLVAYRIAERDYGKRAGRAFAPWAALILALGGAAIWLMAQPMEMRGMMMLMG